MKKILCPFAVYYVRYGVRPLFTMSRIYLADGKRAGLKVQCKVAVAVKKVKPLYFLSRSFEIREKYCQQSYLSLPPPPYPSIFSYYVVLAVLSFGQYLKTH